MWWHNTKCLGKICICLYCIDTSHVTINIINNILHEQEWRKSHLGWPQGVVSYDYVGIDGSFMLTKLVDSLLGVVYYPA